MAQLDRRVQLAFGQPFGVRFEQGVEFLGARHVLALKQTNSSQSPTSTSWSHRLRRLALILADSPLPISRYSLTIARARFSLSLPPPKTVLLAIRSADLNRRRQCSSLRQPGKS